MVNLYNQTSRAGLDRELKPETFPKKLEEALVSFYSLESLIELKR